MNFFLCITVFFACLINSNSYASQIENNLSQKKIDSQESNNISIHEGVLGSIATTKNEAANTSKDQENKPDLEKFIVNLEINHENTDIISTVIKNHLNHILVPAEDLKNLDINTEYLNQGAVYLENVHYIDLDLLPGTVYHFNVEDLFLTINFNLEGMELQNLNGREKEKAAFSQASNSAVLDYDVNIMQGNNSRQVAGIQELSYFTDKNGTFDNSVFIKHFLSGNGTRVHNQPRSEIVRLESNWSFDKIDSMASWRVGDSITRASDWSGSTRFIGAQYSTNFAVRPDLVTYPLLNFIGQAELPSTIDIYADSMQVYHNRLRTGDFNINQLPVHTGKGKMIVKTTDITGKVRTLIFPYYLSPVLLKEGLEDFSYEGGFQRRNYGLDSNKYKDFIFSGDYKKGVSDRLTLGGHAEGKLNKASAGVSGYFNLYDTGIVSASLATNILRKAPGQRLLLGYNYNGDQFNFSINSTFNLKKFTDIYSDSAGMSGQSYYISCGYNNEAFGSFYTTYTSTPTYDSNNKLKKFQFISMTYEKDIARNSVIRANFGTSLQKHNRTSFASLSFNINLDNKSMGVSSGYQDKVRTDQVSINSFTNETRGWDYKTLLSKKPKTIDYDIEISKRGSIADSTLYLFDYDHNPSQQLDITGSMVFIDKELYFTKSVENSLVLVKTGELVDVPVYNNNQYVGATDKHGKILVPNVTPYVSSEIRLDEKKIPLDTRFSNLSLQVAPPGRSGVILNFDNYKVKSLEMQVIDTNGKALELNTALTIDGIADEVLVGYNGKVYIEDIKSLEFLKGKEVCEMGKCCTFEAAIDKTDKNPVLDLGVVVCE